MKIILPSTKILDTAYAPVFEAVINTYGALSSELVFIDNLTLRVKLNAEYTLPVSTTNEWLQALVLGLKVTQGTGLLFSYFMAKSNESSITNEIRTNIAAAIDDLDHTVTHCSLKEYEEVSKEYLNKIEYITNQTITQDYLTQAKELYKILNTFLDDSQLPENLNSEEQMILKGIFSTTYDIEKIRFKLTDDTRYFDILLPNIEEEQNRVYEYLQNFNQLKENSNQDESDFISSTVEAVEFYNEFSSYYLVDLKVRALREAKFALDKSGIEYSDHEESLDSFFQQISQLDESIEKRRTIIMNVDAFLNAYGFVQEPTFFITDFGELIQTKESYEISLIRG